MIVGQASWPVDAATRVTGQEACPTGHRLPWPPSCRRSHLFAYFIEPAKTGVCFALSEDGYHYTPLNGGKPWLPPSHEGELVRDASRSG
jgi:hypothetical protein